LACISDTRRVVPSGSHLTERPRSGNILTDRLRKLTTHGLLAQRTAPSGRRQEYVLTDAGRDLFPVILTLRQWGERHAFAPGETHSTLVDRHGTPVPEIAPTSADGTVLDADTTHVQKTR
jgi:hypothetical protein